MRKKISQGMKGKPSWIKGKHHSKETKAKIGFANSEERSSSWKGDKVSYSGLHKWVRSHKPKSMFCEKCGKVTDKLDLHSINHIYRRDISKWQWLCTSCNLKETSVKPSRKALKKSYEVRKKNHFRRKNRNTNSM
jgi:hypothetical protein